MIPEELRALSQWVAWSIETKANGKRTKVPYSPINGHRASSVDPSTWGAYRAALCTLDADGVGFVFSPDDPYVGVDMDNCVSGTGSIHPAAYEIVHRLGGYVEFSPSGLGLHVIVRGRLDRGRHTLKTPWRDELALYDRGRFFTMSGEGRGQIVDAYAELDAILAEYFPAPVAAPPMGRPKPVCDDDAAVLDRVRADPRIAALWAGETAGHGGDHSTADLALCAHLAYFTGNDAERTDALFRASGLMREKWDEPRGETTYGWLTIQRALGG